MKKSWIGTNTGASLLILGLSNLCLSAAASSQTRTFDGDWNVVVDCAVAPDGAKGYRWQFKARVTDGSLLGQFGEVGLPSSGTLTGEIHSNGSALLRMKGLTGDPAYNVGRIQGGQTLNYTANVQFKGSRGSGKRNETRSCSLGFSKI
jgi:hypothetical protein